MTTDIDIAAIAERLTKAQRRVMFALSDQLQSAHRTGLVRQAVASAGRHCGDLIAREWQDGCAQCTYYRLTPLGLSVKRYLEDQAK